MDLLFGRRKTPAEMLRQHQRTLQKAQRELDRERVKLEAQEKKLISDIKKSAKANQLVGLTRHTNNKGRNWARLRADFGFIDSLPTHVAASRINLNLIYNIKRF